jgi:hypothetical protein
MCVLESSTSVAVKRRAMNRSTELKNTSVLHYTAAYIWSAIQLFQLLLTCSDLSSIIGGSCFHAWENNIFRIQACDEIETLFVCVCARVPMHMCMRVCVWERERERMCRCMHPCRWVWVWMLVCVGCLTNMLLHQQNRISVCHWVWFFLLWILQTYKTQKCSKSPGPILVSKMLGEIAPMSLSNLWLLLIYQRVTDSKYIIWNESSDFYAHLEMEI